MSKTLLLALIALSVPEDLVLVGPTLSASWIWAAEGVKVRRSGSGQYDGFPVEKDPARGDDAVVVIEVPDSAGGVIHAGLAFKGDYKPVDCSAYREAGVLEYVVFDRFERRATVYRDTPTGPAEQVIPEGGLYRTELLPGFELPIAPLLGRADFWKGRKKTRPRRKKK